jgi:hypothetical protein
MKKSLRQIYRQKHMIRPTLFLMFFKALVLLVLALIWNRLDHGARGIGYGFSILGLLLMVFAWFAYLSLDGLSFHHLLEERKNKRKTKVRAHDMIDFVEEDVVSFHDLEKEEKAACRMVSSLVVGLVYFLLGTVMTLL